MAQNRDTANTLTFTWQSRTGMARHIRPEPLIRMILVTAVLVY
jgi:hypothetical protein